MSTPLLCHPLHLVVPPVSFVISIHSSLMPPACLLQGHSASTWKVRKLYTTGKQKIYFNHRVTLFWNSILQVFVSVSVINYMKQRIKKNDWKWCRIPDAILAVAGSSPNILIRLETIHFSNLAWRI